VATATLNLEKVYSRKRRFLQVSWVYYPLLQNRLKRRGSKLKTCPYCGSKIEKINHDYYYCDFCSIQLDARVVKENHERLDVRFRDLAFASYIDRTTPEIMTLSTFELCIC